ncbi:putative membrane protein [Microbacterium ginsengiterrae]|uniref:Putative membrane protein n=1 Tax=Microbacterium ginsengiterrae TaxID=546115 RepID=A0A7W9FC93_9MICO|nr:DUF998 domain-containing protein [Microbacterium ginsengiterrae]MBB5742243.1 putative membrane protein [Microbacterium ginsengiterrae]
MSAPTSAGAVVVPGRPSSWRRIVTPAAGTESFAIVVAAAAFILCLPIAAIVFWGRELQISGHASLGQFVAIAGGVSAAAAFLISRSLSTRYRRGGAARRERFLWFDLTALAVGYAAIALLGWLGAATVMEHSFTGATVFSVPAMLLASAAVAVSAYIAYISGSDLSASGLSLVLALFLVVGMVTAMLSAQNPQWWQMNLSALGMTHDISSLTFNLTLIVSGIMVTTIARIGTAAIPTRSESEARRRTAVRVLFVLLGVLLACVGVFPVDRFFLLHNTVATGMTVAFAALVFGLPWLVPTMPKSFVVLGFVFVAVMVVLVVFFFTGVYNLTAVELIAAVMIFAWIILFLRNVQSSAPARLEEPAPTASVEASSTSAP